ncbi:hypothetical protein MRX60_13340 (plasmid) [Xylella fastidiosa subsp. pauca]|uniref:hypothetical protein n=1 Tax=Xylella fastidiosa TaxID=2371 RepID=UPI00241D41A1|nr:hypothetical protein [Xylella fastidiosa]MDG5827005.1 hypothetical protein [Xylella fastidiosa subsp. pauca]
MKAIGQFKEIISMENMAPALVDKIFWYQEPIFQARQTFHTLMFLTKAIWSTQLNQLPPYSGLCRRD